MNKKIFLFLLFSFGLLTSKAQDKMKVPKKALQRLENFKTEAKFDPDAFLEYPGISDELLRPELTKLINLAADDFIEVAKSDFPTKEAYQEKIKTGLLRFRDVYPNLRQNDIERVCSYYKELMRYVNLKDSNVWVAKFQRGIGYRRN